MLDQYNLIQILFFVLSVALIYLIYNGLKLGLKKAGYADNEVTKILVTFVMIVTVWIIIISTLSLFRFFHTFSSTPPRIMLAVIFPLAVTIYFLAKSKVNRVLLSIPEQWLIYIQSFRVIVEIMLWMLLLNGFLPIQMSFEGRNFDILVGLTAPVIAYFCYTKRKWSDSVALIWNFAGLLLLVNIVTIAVLSMPTKFRVFMNEPANTVVANFPVIFLPAILVPIAYSMHLFSIKQILLKRKAA